MSKNAIGLVGFRRLVVLVASASAHAPYRYRTDAEDEQKVDDYNDEVDGMKII